MTGEGGGKCKCQITKNSTHPQTLYQRGCRASSPDHVLLPLLLLDLQCKSRSQNSGRKSKKRNSKESTETRDNFPFPGDGNGVSVAHSADRDETPPEGVGEGAELPLLHVLLHLVHDEGGEHQERNITAELLRFNCLSRYFSDQVLCSTLCNLFIGRFLTSYGASQAKHQNGQKGRRNEFQSICTYI